MDQSTAPQSPDQNAAIICDGTMQNFNEVVGNACMQVPVIVQFWADWSEPCKQLMPMLEKIVLAAGGAVRLVKVNADENQQICTQLQVKSLPMVMAFWMGKPVDGFQGAMPESEIQTFITKLMDMAGSSAPAADGGIEAQIAGAIEQAEAVLDANAEMALGIFEEIIKLDPENLKAFVGAMDASLKLSNTDKAEEFSNAINSAELAKDKELSERVKRLTTQLELIQSSADAGDITILTASVEADPSDYQARYDLALAHQAAGDMAATAEALLGILMRDMEWNDSAAKEHLLKLFEAAGPMDPFTLKYRRRLSSLIFS